MNVFHTGRKSASQDRNKNTAKFLDPKRDTHGRLKALRVLLDIFTDHDTKAFFQDYSMEVFFVFYEEFTNVELSAKSKGARLKDELEELLSLLEVFYVDDPKDNLQTESTQEHFSKKIFVCLADKVHAKWHFNSIGLILRKFLHHGNVVSLREKAIPVFMLWLHILQENVDDLNLAVYGSLIPCFASPLSALESKDHSLERLEYVISCISGQGYSSTMFTNSLENELEWCMPEGCHSICPPQQGDKVYQPEDLTKVFLDKILDGMLQKILDIQWKSKYMRESGFYHMFSHFKRFYLKQIFPMWDPDADRLYNESYELIAIPIIDEKSISCEQTSSVMLLCQRAVLFWLIVYTLRLKQKKKTISDFPKSMDIAAETSAFEGEAASKRYEILCRTAEIVRTVFYSTQENVLAVHEIFRQGFLMPLNCADTMNHIMSVYKEWFFKITERPVFMLEPVLTKHQELAASREMLPSGDDSPMLRTPSYREAMQSCENIFFANIPVQSVRAGFQPTLRLFIANTAQVFFVSQKKELLSKHADVCKRVMKIYRNIVLEMRLDAQTWEQLLTALLKIADSLLTKKPPTPRHSSLGGQLASYLLQTLFVTWIRASLQVYLEPRYWNELQRIATTLTNWEELVKEWAATMETLTRVMARTVYGIDLQDPPLEKLTHRSKVKRLGGFKLSQGSSFDVDSSQSFTKHWEKIRNSAEIHVSDKFSLQMEEKSASLPRCISEPASIGDKMHPPKATQSDSTLDMSAQYPKVRNKKTLAEIADHNTQSFDSMGSSSVFMNSLNSMCDLKSTVEMAQNQEQDLLDVTSYSPLQSGVGSNLSLQKTLSMNSFLHESSQNLLDSEFVLREELMPGDTVRSPGVHTPDSFLTASSSDLQQNLLTPRTSVSSEQDLINFELAAVKETTKLSGDAESIDSHMFTLIDNESFNELKSPTSTSQSDVLEEENEDDMTLKRDISHVRFASIHLKDDTISLNDDDDADEQYSHEEESQVCCQSVIAGGEVEGWTRISSMVLWQRIIGVMGNINEIKDGEIHAQLFRHLIKLYIMLETVKRNQGVSIDNKVTPPPPKLSPPLFCFSTWCFQAMVTDSVSHKSGRVLAYKLACMMMLHNHGLKPSKEHMICMLRLIHHGLISSEQEVINAIISECAPLLALNYDGVSCLITHFITAANSVISTQYLSYPRKEAVTLIGSMLSIPSAFPGMSLRQIGMREYELTSTVKANELWDKLLPLLLKATKNDPSCWTRCIAINTLGLFIVETLIHLGGHARIPECVALIISLLEFHSPIVCTVALDVLFNLTFHYEPLAAYSDLLPLKVVEAICYTVQHLLLSLKNTTSEIPTESLPEYMSRMLLCLLDWVMVLPQELLMKSHTQSECSFSYFDLVMKTLQECCEGLLEARSVVQHEHRKAFNVNQIILGESRPTRLARVHNDIFDEESTMNDFVAKEINERRSRILKLTAKYVISQLLNYYNHFPFYTGAVRPSSVVMETEDHAVNESALQDSSNVQYFLLNNSTLVTLIEIPQADLHKNSSTYTGLKSVSRFILRDSTGKYCWDVAEIFKKSGIISCSPEYRSTMRTSFERKHSRNLSVSGMRLACSNSFLLPTWDTVNSNTDKVDQLLRYIGQSSPECLLFSDQPLSAPAPVPHPLPSTLQPSIVTSVLKQHNEEENYVHEIGLDHRITASEILPPPYQEPISEFHLSKLLLHQLGFFCWEKRKNIELLERNEKLLRDIKNLDNRPCRETHKIAVFYIGPGQEDKHSILTNSCGSQKFEDFLRGMSWEVDLAEHTGFIGGLEKNLSTGASAPYFANHSLEMIFHVSTRMPGNNEDMLNTKLRHLGNDEIHVIWSEHIRDFRRGIINTEFGDVLIVVYPLKNGLYRVQIDCKEEIPPFGPLFDGAIVDGKLLPVLVRSTAISAGRAKRTTIPLYNHHFEERVHYISEITKCRVQPTSFEDFTSLLFSPAAYIDDLECQDGLSRASSLPSRKNPSIDPVLKLLDMPDGAFRDRTSSTYTKKPTSEKFSRTSSNNSLNHTDDGGLLSDTDQSKDRRKSISRPKRLKKKTLTLEGSAEENKP